METKPFTEEIRARLADYKARRELSHSELAAELGYNVTQVSKYLGAKPDWDVSRMESVIDDVLANESRREQVKLETFETPISEAMGGVFERTRKTNDISLTFGPAGVGKSKGVELYAVNNPSCIVVTATMWKREPDDIEGAIFRSVSNRGWDGRTKRGDWAVQKLHRSNRLIIIDNAQRLKMATLAWLFDFHDATGCPIALVGNPEVLEVIRTNDQLFSRIGYQRVLKLKAGVAATVARRQLKQHLPEAEGELASLAEMVGENQGHFRSVRKQLILAKAIRDKKKVSWSDAFKAAHTQLVRDYKLD
jgi:DNA transposition AAA+ family ATPase